MREFFNNILFTFRGIGSADKHQKLMFYGSIIAYILLGFIFGYLSSVIFTAFIGLVYELTYCYVPYKEIEFFGRYIVMPDYVRFKNEFNIFDTKVYHEFSLKNIYFCLDGILIGIIIRIIFAIL
jgi:putative flippase GtrA